jgi:predicted ATPase
MSGQYHNHPNKIVLTGGPGGGKTTAADLFRREIGEEIVVVPEAATLLFSGGFPRSIDEYALKASQTAIFHVQKNLENAQAALYPQRSLLCDRGTVDSSIYWPGGPEDFFKQMNTKLETELSRYSAVVFFESAAVGNSSIEGGNPVRNESLEEARRLDQDLYNIWSKHPQFYHIKHQNSFFGKMENAIKVLRDVLNNKKT